MISFLADILETLIKSFINMFILKNVMDKADTMMKLLKVEKIRIFMRLLTQ